MNITIIGSGYVGLVTGACLADLGNKIFFLDLNQEKIDLLNSGKIPIYEPGLQDMIERNRGANRIQFSTDIEAAVHFGDIQFIAVGTPSDENGSADIQYVLSAAANIARYMTGFKVIVNKSTVPVGTADKVKAVVTDELLKRGIKFEFSVVSNPEFLKEGAAITDFLHPDRIIIGTFNDASGQEAKEMMRKLYAPFNRHHERTYYMDTKSAELTKYAANSMLATRISFMNELASLAENIGADIEQVRQGIGSDSRIGHSFLYAGTGYGGSCFPKDIRALIKMGNECNQDLKIIRAVEYVNEKQKYLLVNKVITRYGNNLSGKIFAIWGMSFKPNTDDMREAPSRLIIQELVKLGAKLHLYDPVAMNEAKRVLNIDFKGHEKYLGQLFFMDGMRETLAGANALIVVTEWKEFRSPDLQMLKSQLLDAVIFDGRNIYEPLDMHNAGFEYYSIGRKLN